MTCNGVSEFTMDPASIFVGLANNYQAQAQMTYNTGAVYYSTAGTWSSGNSSIAGVNATGLVRGVSAGVTPVSVYVDNLPAPAGYICLGGTAGCPVIDPQASAPANVVGVTISGPSTVIVGDSIQLTATASGNSSGGTYSWSSSSANVSLTNSAQATVTVGGITPGLATLTVTYTYTQGGETTATTTQMQIVTVQKPTYFVTSAFSQAPTPSICSGKGYNGYYLTLSNFVADQNGTSVPYAGITPLQSISRGPMLDYATPASTTAAGTFEDTPYGSCYDIIGQFCTNGPTVTHSARYGSATFTVPTVYNSRDCTEGERVVITGNLPSQNKTISMGTVN